MTRRFATLSAVVAAVGLASLLTLPAGAEHGRGYQQAVDAGVQFQPNTIYTVPGVKGPQFCVVAGSFNECKNFDTPPVPIGTPLNSIVLKLAYTVLGTTVHFPNISELAGQLKCTDGTYVPGVDLTVQPGNGQSVNLIEAAVLVNGQPYPLGEGHNTSITVPLGGSAQGVPVNVQFRLTGC